MEIPGPESKCDPYWWRTTWQCLKKRRVQCTCDQLTGKSPRLRHDCCTDLQRLRAVHCCNVFAAHSTMAQAGEVWQLIALQKLQHDLAATHKTRRKANYLVTLVLVAVLVLNSADGWWRWWTVVDIWKRYRPHFKNDRRRMFVFTVTIGDLRAWLKSVKYANINPDCLKTHVYFAFGWRICKRSSQLIVRWKKGGAMIYYRYIKICSKCKQPKWSTSTESKEKITSLHRKPGGGLQTEAGSSWKNGNRF